MYGRRFEFLAYLLTYVAYWNWNQNIYLNTSWKFDLKYYLRIFRLAKRIRMNWQTLYREESDQVARTPRRSLSEFSRRKLKWKSTAIAFLISEVELKPEYHVFRDSRL